jgi:hypothetical protein
LKKKEAENIISATKLDGELEKEIILMLAILGP